MKKQDKEAAKEAARLEREAARAEAKLLKAESKRSKQIPPPPPLPFPTVSSWADPEEIFAQTPSSSSSTSRSVSPRSTRASRYKPYPPRPSAKPYGVKSKSPATPPSPSFIDTLMPTWLPPDLVAEQEREQEQLRQQQGTSSSSSTSRRSPSSSSESMFEAPSSTTSLTLDRSGMTFDDAIVAMGDWTKPSPPPSPPPPAASSPLDQWPSLESGTKPNSVWDNEDAGDGFGSFLVSPGANENNTLTLDIPNSDPLSFPLNSRLPSDVTAAFATITPHLNEPFQFELNLGEFKGEAPAEIDVAFADWAQDLQNDYWGRMMGPPDLGNMAQAPELAPLNFDVLSGDLPPNFFTTPPSAPSHQQQHQERLPSFDFGSFMGIHGGIEAAPRVTSSSTVADPFAQYTNENVSSYEDQSAESLPSPTHSHDGMPVGHTLGLHFPSHAEVEQQHHHNEMQSREDERDSFEQQQPRNYSGPIYVPQPRSFTGPIDLYQDPHGRVVSNGSTSSGSTATYHASPASFAPSPPQPRPQYAPPPGAANSGGRRVGASWGNYRMMQAKPLHEEQDEDEESLGPLDVGRRSTSSWVQQHQHSRVSSHRSPSSPLTLTP